AVLARVAERRASIARVAGRVAVLVRLIGVGRGGAVVFTVQDAVAVRVARAAAVFSVPTAVPRVQGRHARVVPEGRRLAGPVGELGRRDVDRATAAGIAGLFAAQADAALDEIHPQHHGSPADE